MTREIVLDTETTGIYPGNGHRLVEIGAVEIVNSVPTGREFHRYLDPQRDMPLAAFRVHGLSEKFLRGKPLFGDVVDDLFAFIREDHLVIHNAAFDLRFLNAELARLNRSAIPMSSAIDTLALARQRFPGSPASLDALCSRFGVDNSRRSKHGALIDAKILVEVYAELNGGRRTALERTKTGVVTSRDEASLTLKRPIGLSMDAPRNGAPLITAS
jgi:DNA polymerase-3 subunit epsilon